MTDFLIAASVVFVLVAVGATLVAWRVVRRARRRFGGWHARYLDTRTRFLTPGPRRDAARLRYRLHAELAATTEMLTTAPQGRIFRADAAAVLQELVTAAGTLDTELAGIERFMDAGQQRDALATIAPQVQQLIDMTYSARQTILRTAAEDRTRQLSELRSSVAAQAAALQAYQRRDGELTL
ncbi:MAG TPA: hypothetical protein VKB75_09760 [Jatrophihabitans sp.]|nr:hypothetical protein [Jatrophihabitans sp.]